MRGPLQYGGSKPGSVPSIPGSGSLYAIRMQRLRDIIGPATNYNDYLKAVNSKEFNSLLNQKPQYNKEMVRFLGGMALQQGLGSIAEYMQATGNQNAVAAGGAL